MAGRTERGTDYSHVADQGLRSQQDLAPSSAQGQPCEAKGYNSEADASTQGGRQMDAEFGDGAVHKRSQAEDQRDDTSERKDAVAGELRLKRDHDQRGHQQQHGGMTNG